MGLQHLPATLLQLVPLASAAARGCCRGPSQLRSAGRGGSSQWGSPGPVPARLPDTETSLRTSVPTGPGDKMAAVAPVTGRGAAPHSGRQGALSLAPLSPAPSHKAPRRRPAGLFPASVMAVSGGSPQPWLGSAGSIHRHPLPSAFGGARPHHGLCGREPGRESCGAGMGREKPASRPGDAAAVTGRGLLGAGA